MDFRSIVEENIFNYSDYVDRDVAENMGRVYYRGMAGFDPDDDSLLSLLIWELKSVEDVKDTESELKWIYAVDPSSIPDLLDGYRKEALYEDVKKTFFESTSLEKEKTDSLGMCGFSLASAESRDINVTVEECKELPIAKKKAPPYIQSIASLYNREFDQGLMNVLFRYDDPALEDLAYLPKEWFEQSVSCFTKTDDKVTGFFLVHKCPSGILVPVLFYAVGADSAANLIEMLRFSIRRAAEIYPGDTVIRIHRRNPEVNTLSGRFFPGRKGEKATTGERIEKG